MPRVCCASGMLLIVRAIRRHTLLTLLFRLFYISYEGAQKRYCRTLLPRRLRRLCERHVLRCARRGDVMFDMQRLFADAMRRRYVAARSDECAQRATSLAAAAAILPLRAAPTYY